MDSQTRIDADLAAINSAFAAKNDQIAQQAAMIESLKSAAADATHAAAAEQLVATLADRLDAIAAAVTPHELPDPTTPAAGPVSTPLSVAAGVPDAVGSVTTA